jgi:SAM-dependent methyltransferase
VAGVDRFAGGDQRYLRDVQYHDAGKLTARARLHQRYRTAAQPWFPWLASQIDWPSPAEVLEVGCGPGWMWIEAAQELPAGLRLMLSDLSPGMVEAARQRVSAGGRLSAVTGTVADAQRLPFADGSFDVVVANHMLYHVPDPTLAVSELARVLRPDGWLLAAANGPGNLREVQEIRAQVFGVPPESRLDERFGSVSGVPMLSSSFARVEWRSYPDELRCTEPEDVIAYITSYPPGEDPPPDLLEALRRAVGARFGASGVFTITKSTGAFVARPG